MIIVVLGIEHESGTLSCSSHDASLDILYLAVLVFKQSELN